MKTRHKIAWAAAITGFAIIIANLFFNELFFYLTGAVIVGYGLGINRGIEWHCEGVIKE